MRDMLLLLLLPPTMLIQIGTQTLADHITSELEKLSMREKYNGSDQIHVANGSDFEEGSPSRKV